jgi:GAF domain-containing protein
MTIQVGTQGGHEFVPAEHTPPDGDAPRRALALAQIRWRSTNMAVSTQRFLAESVQLIADALEVPLVKVLELERSGKWLLVRAGVGWAPGIVGRAKVPVGTTSHAGLTISMDTPVIYDNLPHVAWFSESDILRRHDVVSGMSAVVGAGGRPVGVLTVHHTRQRTFTPAEAKFLLRAAALISEGIAARSLQDSRASETTESATSQENAVEHQLPLGLTRQAQ